MNTYPHESNFCAGAYPDWLEVNLLPECNGSCSWCIEKEGYHPEKRIYWEDLADKAIDHGAGNIILLGGEPTLYPRLQSLITKLNSAGRNVWITTNGSRLTTNFVNNWLKGIHGVNISIHHYHLGKNREITGIDIDEKTLIDTVAVLNSRGVKLRLNCNCIPGYIDSPTSMTQYLSFAKSIGVKNVRFSELRIPGGEFVNIPEILNYQYGLTDDPFKSGCSVNTVIEGVNVNFRIMCGLQTAARKPPCNPQQVQKYVLYYDGEIYNGWQTKGDRKMTDKELVELLEDVKNGTVSAGEAAVKIVRAYGKKEDTPSYIEDRRPLPRGGGCHY